LKAAVWVELRVREKITQRRDVARRHRGHSANNAWSRIASWANVSMARVCVVRTSTVRTKDLILTANNRLQRNRSAIYFLVARMPESKFCLQEVRVSLKKMFVTSLLVAIAGVTLGSNVAVAEDKVTVCHNPPGNPSNANRITVSQSALAAHLAHGDVVLGSAFVFYSGAASASSGSNGESPITTGLGADLASDPITKVGTPAGIAATIIATNGAWNTIPNTKWISYGNTTTNGPANNTTVDFYVQFNIPSNIGGCSINPSVTISALGDDEVTASLNGSQVGPSPLASFGTIGTTATSTGITSGVNTLKLSVTQTGGDGFGLNYRVIVILD
jgi:hypothetical protein